MTADAGGSGVRRIGHARSTCGWPIPQDADALRPRLASRARRASSSRPTVRARDGSDPFAVLERFHLAVAIVTVLGSTAFLLALMVMRAEERRETIGIIRLIGISQRIDPARGARRRTADRGGRRRVRHPARASPRRAPSTASSSGATTPRSSSSASRASIALQSIAVVGAARHPRGPRRVLDAASPRRRSRWSADDRLGPRLANASRAARRGRCWRSPASP